MIRNTGSNPYSEGYILDTKETAPDCEITKKVRKATKQIEGEKEASLDLKDKKIRQATSQKFVSSEEELFKQLTQEEIEKYHDLKEQFLEMEDPRGFDFFDYIAFPTCQIIYPERKAVVTLEQFQKALSQANYFIEFYCLLRLDPKAVDLIYTVPGEDIGDRWENYIVRKDGFEKIYKSDQEGQSIYGQMMHRTLEIASFGISQDWTFSELMNFLVWRRNLIAKVLEAPHYDDVGSDRKNEKSFSAKTPLVGVYEDLFFKVDLSDINKKQQLEASSWIEETDGFYKYMAFLNGREMDLSIIAGNVLYHVGEPRIVDEIMDHVKKLYDLAIKEEVPEKIYYLGGQIFWWICQAKPWVQGDPSIAESLFRTIFYNRGLENFAWQKGLIPWAAAMSEPNVNKFAENFYKLFEIPNLQG